MHQNVRKMTLWALLLLPLVAVGVAVTLMVSWGGGSQGAQAAGADPQIHTYGPDGPDAGTAPDCDTDPDPTVGNKCSVPEGTNFNVTVSLVKLAGLTDVDGDTIVGWNGISWTATDTANLTLVPNFPASVKNCAGGLQLQAGADGSYNNGCNIGVGQSERTDTGNMFSITYTCTSAALVSNITQINGGGPNTNITDEGNVAIAAGPDATEVLNINCTPPDREIQINKTDLATGAFVGPTCWQLFVVITPNPLSPPINLPVDVVGDNVGGTSKLCAGAVGAASDSNPALGEIDITISGAARALAGSDEWHVLETQAPPKYQITNLTKQVCDLSTADCVVNVTNTRVDGNINVSFNDTVTGQPLLGQCVDIDDAANVPPPIVTICDGGVGDTDGVVNGEVHSTQPVGSYSVDYNPLNLPLDRQVKALPGKVLCVLAAGTPKCSVKIDFNPTIPFNLKSPTLANLFLTAQGSKLPPSTCAASTNVQTYSHLLSSTPSSADPKDPTAVQQVGGFEMNVLFNEDLICVNLAAGAYFTETAGAVCFIDDKDQGLQPDGLARIGCVIKGKPLTVSSSLQLAVITVRPQPELYSLITADQDNGVNAQILNSGCNLSDMQGHPIKKVGCNDSEVTIRWLEGDVNGDCAVDVRDQQILAFRWGAKIGSGLLYNPRFDLEPSGAINNDGDIDIKDVQFVYGRHGSVCTKSGVGPTIWPPQPPRNEKLSDPAP